MVIVRRDTRIDRVDAFIKLLTKAAKLPCRRLLPASNLQLQIGNSGIRPRMRSRRLPLSSSQVRGKGVGAFFGHDVCAFEDFCA